MLNLGAVLEASLQHAAAEGTDESFTLVDTRAREVDETSTEGKQYFTHSTLLDSRWYPVPAYIYLPLYSFLKRFKDITLSLNLHFSLFGPFFSIDTRRCGTICHQRRLLYDDYDGDDGDTSLE